MKPDYFSVSIGFSSKETDLLDWLKSQNNKTQSVKFLIRQAIAAHGNDDIIELIMSQANLYSDMNTTKSGAKRGRPRKNDNVISPASTVTAENISTAPSATNNVKLPEAESIQADTKSVETALVAESEDTTIIAETEKTDDTIVNVNSVNTISENDSNDDIDFGRFM